MRPFRFESMWVGKNDCTAMIEDNWAKRGAQGPIMPLHKQCGDQLLQWNKSTFGNVQANLGNAKNLLSKPQGEDSVCSRLE